MQTTPISLIDQDHEAFFEQLLAPIQASEILDVACGPGGFTGVLASGLKGYRQITGIDISETAIAQAKEHFTDQQVIFQVMDAASLVFPDSAFDLVCCAFSLHHLPDPALATAEIRRVLKPGGTALFVEMYRDQLSETQQTESMLHHWAGEIDSARGISHRQTYTRQEIIELVQPTQWQAAQVYDLVDFSFDPKGEEITQLMESSLKRVLQRAEGLPDYTDFLQRAEQIRERVHTIGTHVSTRLVIVMEK